MGYISKTIKWYDEKRKEIEKEKATRALNESLDTKFVDLECVRFLLDSGADPNMYVGKLTALHRAALGTDASLDAVQLLLERGANPFLPVAYGLREFRLSSLIKEHPDLLDCIVHAEKSYEKQNGSPPILRSRCKTRLNHRSQP